MKSSKPNAVKAVDHQVVVIGAGFSGINAGIELKRQGIDDFLIVERANDVGGTWRDNTYPGCACDVPSHLYSYSFEQNPDWSNSYSGSHEIYQYIRRCAAKYGLHPHLRFGTGIRESAFDERSGIWTLTTEAGETLTARAVISAVGGLVDPSWPTIAGLDEYRGAIFHTARWDHSADLKGKRVAVIGTGASAIQVIPSICGDVAELKVLQRTPPWVIPKPATAISAKAKATFKRLPLAQRVFRGSILSLSELVFGPAVILDSPLSGVLKKVALWNLEHVVKDPELRRKLTPDYEIGCKRVLFASDYYPALVRENVEVITEGIASFTPQGLRLKDGRELVLDAVVMATGFRINISAPPFLVKGLEGRSLSDRWRGAGGKAYKGVATPGVPNWFFMLGPNTGPGHTSVLIYTEAQARYIVKAIKTLLDDRLRYVSVRRDVLDGYHRKLQNRMKYTSWTSGCSSWYLDEHGENHTLFPGLATEYALGMKFKLGEYDVVA